MGVIADSIEKQVADYVRDRGMVLWFDPERHYEDIARGLRAGQERVLVLDGGFYKLRLAAEPFLRGFDAPKLLVYLPIAWEQAEEPLAEMLALGVDLRPGVSGNRNTRLAVVARRALKGRIPEARLADLDRQIDQGGLTLAELEDLTAEGGGGSLPTVLAVHFGTALIEEAALYFLARPERDAELAARNGLADWAQALAAQYGLTIEANASAGTLRTLLTRQALTCELLETLSNEAPEELQRLVSKADPIMSRRAAQLAKEWRNRRDIADTYPVASSVVERALHLESIDFTDAALERIETFCCLEQRLLRRAAVRIISDPGTARIAEYRQRGFWAEQDTELQAEWALVLQAGQLLERAAQVENALRARRISWAEIIECYTGAANWAELDTLHRRLERRASSLEFALATPAEEIEQLVHAVRRRHQEVSGAQAEQFTRAWRAENFASKGYLRQSEIYERYVGPVVSDRRTAYVLVDALRWELARELPEVLGRDFEVRIELAIGTAPSITEVGMAALLPSAASGLRIGGTTKLQVSLHGQVLKNRQDRVAYLRERAGVPVVDLKLEDLRNFRRKLKDLGEDPALIFVTSREIDQSGEDEMTNSREHMERVLTHLGLALRKLAEEGVDRFIIAADHGYLYGEDLAESEKIDPPGGKTILCHRRVWAGQGAAASANYLLTEVSRFGAASDLEMAVPWNLAGFRTSGPTAYFHGGLSPQEILLPVILATSQMAGGSKRGKKLIWDLALGSTKVTTRFLSVRLQARSDALFAEPWPTVRVEVRAAGEVCAIPVSGAYGFQESTGSVVLRSLETESAITEVNTIALMLTAKAPARGTVSIHLVDAATGVELKKIENVEVSIAI
jgi:hypothetical protein